MTTLKNSAVILAVMAAWLTSVSAQQTGDALSLTNPPQIDLQVRIVQTTPDGVRATGIAWADSGDAANLAVSVIATGRLDNLLAILERVGQGRVVSSPQVSIPSGSEAEIMQGIQVPVQTAANNTITVTWKDVGLQLRVLPQVASRDTMTVRVATGDPSLAEVATRPSPTLAAARIAAGDTMVVNGAFSGRNLLIFITPRVNA